MRSCRCGHTRDVHREDGTDTRCRCCLCATWREAQVVGLATDTVRAVPCDCGQKHELRRNGPGDVVVNCSCGKAWRMIVEESGITVIGGPWRNRIERPVESLEEVAGW